MEDVALLLQKCDQVQKFGPVPPGLLVFYNSLPNYLLDELENLQKCAVRIMFWCRVSRGWHYNHFKDSGRWKVQI